MFATAVDLLAALSGLVTASIVIGGFLAHVYPAITGAEEARLRRATAVGGLVGVAVAALVVAGLRLAM